MARDTPPLCLNGMLWIDLYFFLAGDKEKSNSVEFDSACLLK